MAIEKYFDSLGGPEVVFNPIPSFSGGWLIFYENLVKNAKVENGQNLFLNFMKKNYDDPLYAIFQTDFFKTFPIILLSIENDNRHGRCLDFYADSFYSGIFNFLNFNIDKVNKTEEEHNAYLHEVFEKVYTSVNDLNLAVSDALKIKCDRLNDVKTKEFNSEYFDAAMKDYEIYKNTMPFHTFIKVTSDVAHKLQEGVLKLGNFLDKKLDYQELYQAFEPDKFYLLLAVSLYDNLLLMAKNGNIVKNCAGYLEEYFKACNEICKEEKNYNPNVLYEMASGKKIRYTRRELQRDYEEFIQKHPEAKPLQLPPLKSEERDKYLDIDLVEKLTKLTENDTRINWEFLPKGEGEKRNQETIPKQDISKDNKNIEITDVIKREEFLENSGFMGKLKGLNTFTGYYAYVYPNGNVILEKFWEDEMEMKPAIYCATYIMNIDNFVSMSKISKINLVEYIKTLPEIGVKRLYHSSVSNWQKNIYKEINGAYRLEDAIEFINSLKSGGDSREQ